jgi:hypothetical protein
MLLQKYLKLAKVNMSYYPCIRNFAAAALKNAELKFDPSLDKVAMIAAMLDPRYRTLQSWEPADQGLYKSQLKSEWELLRAKFAPTDELITHRNKRQRADKDKDDEDDLEAQAGVSKFNADKNEYERYVDVKHDEDPNSCDILHWWKEHEKQYPLLARLARKYLAIPASSAPSERVFSRLKNIITHKRVRMSSETLCQLLFVHYHQQLLLK